MPDRSHFIGAAILLFSGLIFAGIAAFIFYQQFTLAQGGIQTTGTVITLVESSDSDGTSYAPVVRFKTRNEREYQFQSSFYSYPPQYEVGQIVTVLYPPDQPTEARIKGEGNLLMIIFGLVGGLELLIGLFLTGKGLLAQMQGE